MAINKVEYGEETLIDLTNDTVDEQSVLEGRTFHAKDGTVKEGKVVVAEVIDDLTSTSTTDALSANQGKVLNDKTSNIYNKGFASDNLMPISKLERNNEGWLVENYPIYLPKGTYSLSADVERGNGGWVWIFSKNGVDIATFDGGYENAHYYQIRVLNSDVDSLRVYTNAKVKAHNIMLNEGTELPYQPYAKSNIELTECINTISDAYNPSKAYAQGEFCIYNNTLWKSKVNNNTSNTPRENSYWTATNIVNSLNALSEKFYTLYNVSDLDNVNENCIISVYGKSELGGEWALILNMVLVDSSGGYNTDFKAQIAVNLQIGTLYKRGKYNGVWTSWNSLG